MNTKGMKFLAVLAVLAMAFAAFAVVDTNKVDAANTVEGTWDPTKAIVIKVDDTGAETIKIYADSNVKFSADDVVGKTHTIKLTGYTPSNGAKYGSDVKGFGTFAIGQIKATIGEGNSVYWIVESTALMTQAAGAGTTVATSGSYGLIKDAETATKVLQAGGIAYANLESAPVEKDGEKKADILNLLPMDGSNVTIRVYKAASTVFDAKDTYSTAPSKATEDNLLATIILDCSELKTKVNVGSDTSGQGWTYAETNKKLTFTSSITDNVEFTMNGVTAGTGTTDAMLAAHGFAAKYTKGTTTMFYQHLEGALGAIGDTTILDADVTVTLLKNDVAVGPVNPLGTSENGTKTLTVDLNGFTYTAYGGIDRGGVMGKAISFGTGAKVIIKNGTINTANTNDITAVIIKSYAPELTLTNVTIDGKNLYRAATGDDKKGSQFTNTDIGNSAALWVANGTATLDKDTKIIGANNTHNSAGTALLVHGFNHNIYTNTKVTSNGAAINGKVVLAADYASEEKFEAKRTATFVAEAGSIVDGDVIKTTTAMNSMHHAYTDLALMTVTVNGGTFSDVTTLPYLAAGKEMTLTAGGTIDGDLTVLAGSKINFDKEVIVKVTGTLSGSSKTTPGTVFLGTGAAITYGAMHAENPATIKSEESGQAVEVKTETEITAGGTQTVEDYVNGLQTATTPEAAVITLNTATSIGTKKIEVQTADVTFVAGTITETLTGVDIVITSTDSDSKAVTFTGFPQGVSGTIVTTDGVTSQTFKLDKVKGTFTVTKGSIIIDGKEYSGSIELSEGADVKMSGTINGGDFSISVTGGKNATVTILKDKKVQIETNHKLILSKGVTLNVIGTLDTKAGATSGLQIADGATVNVTGTVDISVVTNNGTMKVLSGGILKASTTSGLAGAGKYVAYSGSTVIGQFDTEAKEVAFTAYSGSNINEMTADAAADWQKVIGKDAEDGEWKYNGAGKLTLKKYNGTYNFGGFADAITSMEINGENAVSFAFTDKFVEGVNDFVLFGKTTDDKGITSITSAETGSLAITVDISKVKGAELFQDHYLIGFLLGTASATYHINGADISLTISGENVDWTAAETSAMQIIGIDALNGFATYNADIEMDIVSSYECLAIGLDVENGSSIVDNALQFDVIAGGCGVLVEKEDAAFSNSIYVSIEGKKVGLIAKDTQFQSVTDADIKGGADTGKMTVMASIVDVSGEAVVAGITETNASAVVFSDSVEFTAAVSVSQTSVLGLKDAVIEKSLENNAIVGISGNVVVAVKGSITNNGTMTNTGVLGVYGSFTNNGTFTNDGTFQVMKYKFASGGVFKLTEEETTTVATNVKVFSITITDVKANADGSADVIASVVFVNSAAIDAQTFKGTLTPAVDGSYTLTLNNGTDSASATATISLSYAIIDSPSPKFGKSYTMSVAGSIMDGATARYLENNTTGDSSKTISDSIIGTTFLASGADFVVNADSTTNNNANAIVSATKQDAGEIIKGTYNGNLVANLDAVKISEKFTGDLTASGTVTVAAKKTLTGDITAKGTVNVAGTVKGDITTDAGVTSTGTIDGNIVAKNNVEVKNITGNITIDANGLKTVTVKGKMTGDIIYISKYLATPDAKAGEETTYTAKMNVSGEAKGNGFTVKLAAGANATASAAVIPGYFQFDPTMNDLDADKSVVLTLTQGKLEIETGVKLKSGYSFVIEDDTTIEVKKTGGANLDVTEAALKVADGATANFETGSGVPVTYGKVVYIMSFTIDGGAYTIYSDVAYALTNCNEGSELKVGANAPINTNVTVPAGVNIIVDSVTLTFNGYDVKMGENAKITLLGTGKLVFNKSTDNKATAKEGEEYAFYSNSVTVVYGDNVLTLGSVRFNADENTVAGKAATTTDVAKIEVSLAYNEGIAVISAGNGVGDLKLANDEYAKTKAEEKAGETTKVTAAFTVGKEAVFDLKSLTDEMIGAKLNADKDDIVVTSLPTIISVMGIMNVLSDVTINGTVVGEGSIIIDDDKTITINFGKYLINNDDLELYYGAVFTATVFDKRDNGYGFAGVMALPQDDVSATKAAGVTFSFKADKTNSSITFAGDFMAGEIEAVSSSSLALLNVVTIREDAVMTADAAVIAGANVVKGHFKNVEMTKKTDATLKYDSTYTEGAYTVYTVFENIDFDEVSEIYITDDVTLEKKADLSGNDVNIMIAEGKVLKIDEALIIGTPATVLGDEGSSIIGKVKLTNNNAYIIAYADVSLTLAEIIGNDDKDAASSRLDVEDVLYATIFATNGKVQLSSVDRTIEPEIIGYNFTAWVNYNGDIKAQVGDTNAYADAKAVKLTITVKYVTGVDYYMNGALFTIYDLPTSVDYGSYFTAKISDTSKYQGTPVINGLNTYVVLDDAVLVATGVTPIPEPPQPEPEPVVGDSGLSLTDILLIVLVVLIAIMVVILVLRLNRS